MSVYKFALQDHNVSNSDRLHANDAGAGRQAAGAGREEGHGCLEVLPETEPGRVSA